MTIELSLRRRAAQARYFAAIWLLLATSILVGVYFSLPSIADRTLHALSRAELGIPDAKGNIGTTAQDLKASSSSQLYGVVALALAFGGVAFACFLLGRAAFVEMELAARFGGLADSLCIAGEDFDRLEKTASLLMPSTKYLSVPEMFSTKDFQPVVEILKQIQGK